MTVVTNKTDKIRVLLADDQPIVRRGLALLLREQEDIEVVGEAGDGWEAIESVQWLRPDVVLMDIDMPGLSGIDATQRIVESVPKVSVLILTVHDREDFLFQALQTGALGYVLKSIDVDELMAAIRTVHSGDVFIYPRMATMLVGDYVKRMKADVDKDPYERLSTREREVLPMLADGRTNHDIGDVLHISPNTVQTYRQRIMRKLDLHSKTELLKYALRKRLISLEP